MNGNLRNYTIIGMIIGLILTAFGSFRRISNVGDGKMLITIGLILTFLCLLSLALVLWLNYRKAKT